MLGVAFGLQPGGGGSGDPGGKASVLARATAAPTDTPPVASPTSQPTKAASSPATGARNDAPNVATNPGQPGGQPTGEVAGARSGSPAAATPEVDFSRDSTQCGSIQENSVTLSVEQTIAGVSVRVTRAAVYPVEYFRCILMATGGREAISLASSVSKAQKGGATQAVLIDLWITNASHEFGQINLKTASVAAAGQAFAPLATIGGRSEVVVSSGQGRSVTLAIAVKNSLDRTGPMTVSVDAPLAGGKQTAGKYQLFLPTP